ncbi:MAG: hypothetical protein M3R68_06275 [Acidobacteriota bacterium]|nr:hypothetical protein [Acidobacteriota bacterium]
MKRVSETLLITLAVCSLLAVAQEIRAQGTDRGRFYTKSDVERIINRVEERSNAFRKVVDKTLDHGALNGTNREDNINQQVKELENAIDKLKKDFKPANSWEETREQVQTVMNEADEVNGIVRRGRWRRGGAVRDEWALVRVDLNKLAGVYNLRQLVP